MILIHQVEIFPLYFQRYLTASIQVILENIERSSTSTEIIQLNK